MGAFPQGNRKERTYKLICDQKIQGYWHKEAFEDKKIRTDKYKSKYRLRRKFKYKRLEDYMEFEKWIIMNS